MIKEKEIPPDSFPAECVTWERRTMKEYMPPVFDENTGEITYICAICGKEKTATHKEGVSYFLTSRDIPGHRAYLKEGYKCPECENKDE